jgi:hypothetical protein
MVKLSMVVYRVDHEVIVWRVSKKWVTEFVVAMRASVTAWLPS